MKSKHRRQVRNNATAVHKIFSDMLYLEQKNSLPFMWEHSILLSNSTVVSEIRTLRSKAHRGRLYGSTKDIMGLTQEQAQLAPKNHGSSSALPPLPLETPLSNASLIIQLNKTIFPKLPQDTELYSNERGRLPRRKAPSPSRTPLAQRPQKVGCCFQSEEQIQPLATCT